MERSLREAMGNDPIEGGERAPKTRSDVEHVRMRDTPPGASRRSTEPPYYSRELRPVLEPGKTRYRGKGGREYSRREAVGA